MEDNQEYTTTAPKSFEPFGQDWRAMMMNRTKDELIDLIASSQKTNKLLNAKLADRHSDAMTWL